MPALANTAPAVIFDLDGLLVDSEPYWREGFRAAMRFLAAELGGNDPAPTDEDLHQFEGGRVPDTIRTLANHYFPGADINETLISRAADRAVTTASDRMRAEPRVIAHTVSVAHELVSLGYRLAVASSSPPEFIEATLDALGLTTSVTVVESAYALDHAKPHPEVYENTLRGLGVSATNAVALEDSRTGTEAALRAGIPTLWVNANLKDGSEEAAKFRASGGRVRFLRRLSVVDITSIAEESYL